MNPVAALLIFLAGFGVAWAWQADRSAASIQTLRADHEKASGDAARQAARNLMSAQNNADRIDAAAAIRTANLERTLQETKDALKTATHNRPCLGGPALRLLDHATGLQPGTAEPALAGPLHTGSAGPAADPEDEGEDYATDTQVADWIAGAAVLYEKCRARIRDIRAWTAGAHP